MRFDGIRDQLIVALDFVHAEAAAHDDAHAVFEPELQLARLHAEQHATHLRKVVFQREIDVPRTPGLAVGDFAFDREAGERAFDQVLHACGQFADRQRRFVFRRGDVVPAAPP